jgi:GDP-4-dehydro-6-deoxy-D-mannose reductase
LQTLITGAGGFAGSHLADFLSQNPASGQELWGCDLNGQRRPFHPPGLRLVAADLRDPRAAYRLVDEVRPDRIYHLAGQAFVGDSWSTPWETIETNMRAQVNLLEAVAAAGLRPRILVVSSADVYGRVEAEDLPLTEDRPLQPDSPYAVSKIGQDMLGVQYGLSHFLHIVRVRPFNHIGPRQNRRFVAPAFASQIAAIEAGRQPPVLHVGNLSARRDFTDVRDMVRAYVLALEQGEAGAVYNVGSGRSRSIESLLDALRRLSSVPIRVEFDPARLRPVDLPDLVCDARRFHARTGWLPSVPFEQSLRDLLDYERALLAAQPAVALEAGAGSGH